MVGMEDGKKYVRILLNIIIPLTGLFLICFLGPKLLRFFMPFVIGWVIALIANPLVRLLERKLKIVRKHSSVMIVVAVLALIVGVLYFLTAKLFVELFSFMKDLPDIYENTLVDVMGVFQKIEHVFDFLPPDIQNAVSQFTENLGTYMGSLIQMVAAPTMEIAGNFAKGIPNAMVNMIVMILSAYFFIAQQDKLVGSLKKLAPDFVLRYMVYLRKDVRGLIGGYFLAQFRIMFVVGIILAVGFFVLGVEYGLVFAVLIAFLDFLPVFGTGTVLLPWAVVKLFSGTYAYGVGLLLLYVTTQVVRQIIQPKIVGDSMGLPPLVTLFLLYIGFKVRGIAGMILAVPVGLVFINFYKYGAFDSLIENIKKLITEVNRIRRE